MVRRRVWVWVGLIAGCGRPAPDAPCADARLPVHLEPAWDPNLPLILAFGGGAAVPTDAAGLLDHVVLTDRDGAPVAMWAASHDDAVYLCPRGGLRPRAPYVWDVTELEQSAPQSLTPPPYTRGGLRVFTTAATSVAPPITSLAACRAAALRDPVVCHADVEVTDTGDTGDTGPTDDTGSAATTRRRR